MTCGSRLVIDSMAATIQKASTRHGLVFTSVGDPIQTAAFTFRPADLWQVEFRDPTGPTVTTLGAADLTSFNVLFADDYDLRQALSLAFTDYY